MIFQQEQFTQDIRDKLIGITLREVAEQAGISAATISRISLGAKCDMGTFAKLCTWLQRSPNDYFTSGESRLDTIHRVLQGYLEYKANGESCDVPTRRAVYSTFLDELKRIK